MVQQFLICILSRSYFVSFSCFAILSATIGCLADSIFSRCIMGKKSTSKTHIAWILHKNTHCIRGTVFDIQVDIKFSLFFFLGGGNFTVEAKKKKKKIPSVSWGVKETNFAAEGNAREEENSTLLESLWGEGNFRRKKLHPPVSLKKKERKRTKKLWWQKTKNLLHPKFHVPLKIKWCVINDAIHANTH